MDGLLKMLRSVAKRHKEAWTLKGKYVDVRIGSGTRSQRVYMSLKSGFYFFKSVVLGRAAVTKDNRTWNELALMAWQRNADHELVTFAFDKHDRLVGLIRHPAEYLDPEELELYITTVARECDRFEYLIAGRDKF